MKKIMFFIVFNLLVLGCYAESNGPIFDSPPVEILNMPGLTVTSYFSKSVDFKYRNSLIPFFAITQVNVSGKKDKEDRGELCIHVTTKLYYQSINDKYPICLGMLPESLTSSGTIMPGNVFSIKWMQCGSEILFRYGKFFFQNIDILTVPSEKKKDGACRYELVMRRMDIPFILDDSLYILYGGETDYVIATIEIDPTVYKACDKSE